MTPHLIPEAATHLLVSLPGWWSGIVRLLTITDYHLQSWMRECLKLGNLHPLLVLPPIASGTLVPSYEVGVIEDRLGAKKFTLIVMWPYNLSHNKWLANLFKSGSPLPLPPADFPRVIHLVLTSPFLKSSSFLLELSAWSVDLGQVSVELMYLTLLFRVCCLQLVHECLSQAVVQKANPGMDPVHTAKCHVANMLQRSHLLTGVDTSPCTPHPASHPINYRVGAEDSQIRDNIAID